MTLNEAEKAAFAAASDAVRDKIYPILAGLPSHVQEGALADLLASWLAGHVVIDEETGRPHPALTRRARNALLKRHVKVVRAMVPHNEKIIFAGRKW